MLLDPLMVSHAELDGELVTVHTADAQYLSALSLQELESRLPGDRFARVHRRAIVNLEHVVRLEPNEVGGFTARTRTAAPSRCRARPRAICASASGCGRASAAAGGLPSPRPLPLREREEDSSSPLPLAGEG